MAAIAEELPALAAYFAELPGLAMAAIAVELPALAAYFAELPVLAIAAIAMGHFYGQRQPPTSLFGKIALYYLNFIILVVTRIPVPIASVLILLYCLLDG